MIPLNEITYRSLKTEEINRSLFSAFIRRQAVSDCLRKENGAWIIKADPFIDDWSEEDYKKLIAQLRSLSLSGGFVYAAFVHDKLKGFVSVSAESFGSRLEYTDLTNIYVSEDMRRRGIGRRLFTAAAARAAAKGAQKLYISAHSAAESQAFYRAMGCKEAEEYSQKHVKSEPYDCQLEFVLN